MSFNSEYQELRKKRKKNEQENKASNDVAPLVFSMSDIAPVSARNINNIDTDIAPVAKTEEKEGIFDGYFQKGAFEDGYQRGDIVKTIMSTDADIATSLPSKVLDWGENILDAGATGIANIADKFGKEETRDKLIEFTKKDLYDGKDVARKILESKLATMNPVTGALSAIVRLDNMLNSKEIVDENGAKVKVLEDNSILDDKADNLLGSAGEVLVKKGLQAALGGFPIGDVITGVTAFGGQAENALKEGATIDQATGSALISAGAEIIGEKLSGGISFGGKTLDAGLTQLISQKVSGVALRTILNGSLDVVGESLEEVFTEFVSKLGTKLYKEEKLGEILFSDEALQDYADAALAGGLLGGAFSAGSAVKSTIEGTDYKTGLTENENKVVNKEVENRIAEREAKGEKLTKKDKNKIYDEVMEDLPKGYISTDTIESVLDGEGYEAYKNLRDKESSLNERISSLDKEINTLLDKENPTIRDNERLAEARKELETAKSDLEKIGGHINEHITYTRHNMNEVLKSERRGKGSYLSESYNEIGRLSERYVADFSKYEGAKHADAARQTIENAMKRGANNTNRVHDIVDLGASLSADTGIVFDWAGDEDIKAQFIEQQKKEIAKLEALTELSEEQSKALTELKEMLRKVEAGEVKVNGNITDDSIVINLDSKKALESIVGHEIAHSLENTKAYQALKETLFAYAKKKGVNIEAEIEAKTKTYKGVKKAKPEAELLADLVGDYIFNDYNFVLDLAMNNKNTFQKLWDDVKYLCKLATTGSKEARDLARARHNFERAYRESVEPTAKTSGKSNYSLSEAKTPTRKELESKNPIKVINVKEGIESGSYADMKTAALNKATREGWFDAPHHNKDTDSLIFLTEKSFTHAYSNLHGGFGEDTIRCMAHIPEIIQEAVLVRVDDPKVETNREKKVYTFFGAIDGKNGIEPVKLTVKEFDFTSLNSLPKNIKSYFEQNGIMENYSSLYDARALEVIGIEGIKKESDASGKGNAQSELAQSTSDSTISIADLLNLVKGDAEKYIPQYSLSDSDGKQLTKGQQEYFKDSKMRDENGNLKVMYHGSQDAGFHVFDAKMSDDDTSFFFVDRNDVAASYSGTSETYEAQTIRSAEDMNNFLAKIGYGNYKAVEKGGKFELLENNEHVAYSDTAQGLYDEFCWYEGVGDGDANYKVYLNLTNPLVIDAEGRNWNNISREFSQEVYDRYKSLTDSEKTALSEIADWGEYGIFKDEILSMARNKANGKYHDADLASAYEKLGGANANLYDAFSIAQDGFSEESLKEFAVKQMNTRDYAAKAKAEGYDGVIFNNIHDNGGYSNGDEGASTVAIAFSSEQIKSVANDEPTADPDIRFSLSEAVEETKDLMALHNLKSAELLKSFELGGLPMPSIAVIKAEAGHDQYGEISLILPKESIDPQASRDNKVYGGDAWTPTYPRMQYKANEAVAKRLRDKYYAMESEYGYDKVRSLYNYVYELENVLNRSGGEAALKEELYDDTRMMQVYLLDSGKGEVPTVKKEIRTELTDHEVSMYEFFAQRLGDQVIDGVNQAGLGSPIEQRKAYWENHGKAIKEAYGEFLSKEFGFSEEDIQNVLSNMKTADFLKVVRDAKKYQTNGRVTTKTEDDFNATQEAIREAAGEGYRAWVDDLFGGSEEKSGIRNNVDYYTRNGNPRSWEALHWENTLENVVKAMKQQDNTGSEALFGVHKFFAASSKNYKNIAEIKADSDRLHKISDGDYKAAKDSYESRFVDVANRIMDKTESNRFIAQENAMECIVDAVRNSRTHDGIYRELSQYGQLDVTEQDVADIVSLVNDIANMPTGYFEAKPMRAVGFDEVGVFVIPRNADVKLKQELLNRGYAIAEYDPDVEGDRQKVVNSFEKYKFSLSDEGEQLAPLGRRGTYGKDFRVQGDNVLAPVQEGVANNATTTETAARSDLPISDIDYAPIVDERSRLEARVKNLQAEMDSLAAEAHSLGDQLKRDEITVEEHEARVFGEIRPRYNELADERLSVEKQLKSIDETEAAEQGERIDSLTDADAPSEIAPYYGDNEAVTPEDPFYNRDIKEVGNRKVKAYMYENPEVKPFFQKAAEWLLSDLRNTTRGERFYTEVDWSSKGVWSGVQRQTSPDIAYLLDNLHYTYQQIEDGLNAIIEDNGKENNACSKKIEFLLNDRLLKGFEDIDGREIPPDQDYINLLNEKQIKEYNEEARQKFFEAADEYAPFEESAEPTIEAPFVPTEAEAVKQPIEDIAPTYYEVTKNGGQKQQSFFEDIGEEKITRKKLHQDIVDRIRDSFARKGFDFDSVLKKAKNLSTFATVDNTPQRVMEKSLGYKAGQILADETVNKVAQNETEGIKWLNSFTDRKNGLLASISKQYNIKPGSKESAAAQMYAEGFFVDNNNNIIEYGDTELAKDFPNPTVQASIKGLARDPRIRQIYDETLKAINESRARNAYPEIPRLDNYFLHFRAMEDTFSRLGLPFNPNDIRAKDLPTDLNGVTADLKPGQPYFSSAMHRTGQRTSFDLLGGLERYLSSAKNQIYHIDDIQTLRALRNYIADTYGQANGLEGLDILSEEEAQERIKQVYNSHLSTFAKFLNEEANVIAGKTALIDRGLEGIIGRRGITFLDTVNKQVGSNMVGFNVSSSLTNFLAGVQAIAKTNKLACVKALAQTTASKVNSIFGKSDSFVENNPTIIRRKGADRFYRTPFQKVGDAGYVLMSAVDDITTEFIVRAKYNEFVKKGMSEEQAISEADKWTSRLMGDRSLGQMPQVYNSKMLGLVTKFQLEVRNQLDSQFYDTIQEAKASYEDIKNARERNAKTAAKVTATFFELAVLQHLFGKGFEAIAGYNPAFDIISVLATALGFDDDEESEDTALDNIEQGFLELLEDLPYTSTFTGGGRIPISSALPIKELVNGKDEYGNDKSRLKTLGEIAPYYVLPTGYGQVKKTVQGLGMFSDKNPVSGSYTDSGNLRFPVEDTFGNKLQAGIFGQWANENARDYFDNDLAPLKEKQIQEFVDLDIPIKDYRKIREDLSALDTLGEKAVYIANLDLPIDKKNLLINNIADREEDIDLTGMVEYGDFGEFEYAKKYPVKYAFLQDNGITYDDYQNFDEDTKEAWSWAYQNPEKFTLSKSIASDLVVYKRYAKELNKIEADKDENGDSIIGSRKEKVIAWINEQEDLDYGEAIILFKSEYKADDTYNMDIIDYLNGRDDISYDEMSTILKELGFNVDSKGNITWD